MFEGSLVESRGLVVSDTQRWTALGSLTFQWRWRGCCLRFRWCGRRCCHRSRWRRRLELPSAGEAACAGDADTGDGVFCHGDERADGRAADGGYAAVYVSAPGRSDEWKCGSVRSDACHIGMGDSSPLRTLGEVSIGHGPAVTVARPAKVGPLTCPGCDGGDVAYADSAGVSGDCEGDRDSGRGGDGGGDLEGRADREPACGERAGDAAACGDGCGGGCAVSAVSAERPAD